MSKWRPSQTIVFKVLALIRRRSELLATSVLDDDGRLIGVRPPGGTIHFGESREAALVRELDEELDCKATITGPWITLENIYRHEGFIGHEFILATPVSIDNPTLYNSDEIVIKESSGSKVISRWYDLSDLSRSAPPLLPKGLWDHVSAIYC